MHVTALCFFWLAMRVARHAKAVIPIEGCCLGEGAEVVMVRVAAEERVPM